MKNVTVVAAVIVNQKKILCVQRAENKLSYISQKFEFPGGKIEKGETEIDALKREIDEELSMEIEIGRKLMIVEHLYPDFQLTMHTYLCSCHNTNLTLHEHIDSLWLNIEKLKTLDWAAADVPIVDKLVEEWKELDKL